LYASKSHRISVPMIAKKIPSPLVERLIGPVGPEVDVTEVREQRVVGCIDDQRRDDRERETQDH